MALENRRGASDGVWSVVDGRVVGGPAISRTGQRLAFVVHKGGEPRLYIMNADGSGARRVAEELDVRGAPAWSPDEKWLAVAGNRDGEPNLFKVPVAGGAPVLLAREYAIDPVWSPGGQFLVYSGADVGTTFPVKAVSADGAPRPLPPLSSRVGTGGWPSCTATPPCSSYKGDVSHKDFGSSTWRPAASAADQLGEQFALADFDLSSDGRELIFDRAREESDIVLFELPAM